jgi:hypothetical protein
MTPFPMTSIVTLPAGEICLWRINKKIKGRRVPKLDLPYPCGMEKPDETQRGILRVDMDLFSARNPCDERPELIPDGSHLKASGVIIRRVDGLADFTSAGRGRFVIKAPDGTTLFIGCIELMDQVCTHQDPFGNEACNAKNHVEGWLVGSGEGKLQDIFVRAMLVMNAPLDPREATSFDGILNGILGSPSKA